VTLEDEQSGGMMNVIVRPGLYPSVRRVLRESPLLLVEGAVQRQGKVVNVIAQKILSLEAALEAAW